MSVTREIRDRWVTALRSDEYEQGRVRLRTSDGRFCCLGVLCDVVGFDLDSHPQHLWGGRHPWAEYDGTREAPPVLKDLLTRATRTTLANKNDSGTSFHEIADWIETNIEVES